MSSFFFKTSGNNSESFSNLKALLEKLQNEQSIDSWKWDEQRSDQPLEVETNKLSSEELKHILRETGVDVEFTKAPHVP